MATDIPYHNCPTEVASDDIEVKYLSASGEYSITAPSEGISFSLCNANSDDWWISSIQIDCLLIDRLPTMKKTYGNGMGRSGKETTRTFQHHDWYILQVFDGCKLNCKINKNETGEDRIIYIEMASLDAHTTIEIKQPSTNQAK